MAKKRYANFRRARKWHRKFRNALYNGFIDLTSRYSDLDDKYQHLTVCKDHLEIDIVGVGDRAVMIALPNKIVEGY